MKPNVRALAFLLAGLFVLLPTLCSCRKEPPPTPVDPGVTVWSETVIPLPEEYMYTVGKGGLRAFDGRIYADTYKLLPSTSEEEDETIEDMTVSWAADGSDFRDEPEADGIESCREGSIVQSAIRFSDDGIATFEVVSEKNEMTGWFCVRDEKGTFLFSVDLPGCFGQTYGEDRAALAGDGFRLRDAAVVGEGKDRRYLAASSAGLVCLDGKGKMLTKLDPCDVCAVTVIGENVYVFQHGNSAAMSSDGAGGSYSLYSFDVRSGERGEKLSLPPSISASAGSVFKGYAGGYPIYWKNGEGLYGLTLSKDEKGTDVCTAALLIDWNESDLLGDYETLYVLDEETVCAIRMTLDASLPHVFATSLSLLHRLPPEALADQIRLEVAALSPFDLKRLRANAIEFNKAHPGCHVTVTDRLSEYEGDFDAARMHLDAEIADGAIPDILFIYHFNSKLTTAQDYVRAGVFTDLVPLMEASEVFDRAELVGSLTKPFTDEEGRQFLLPTTFNSGVLVSNGAIDGPMTPADMMAYYETLPDDVNLLTADPAGLRWFLLYGSVNDMIDEQAGVCSFDDGRFAEIERFCREKLETVHKEPLSDSRFERWVPVRSGKLILLDTVAIDSLVSYGRLRNQLGGTVVPVGYPNEQGVVYGNLYLDGYIGITEACAHKEEALEYLWTFYAPPCNTKVEFSRVKNASSLTRSGIYAEAEALADYTIVNADDERGWKLVPDEEAASYEGVQWKITREDADSFIAFLDSIEKNVSPTGPLWEIIQSELRSDVPNTPEQLADKIQSRASLYLAEHKK